MAERFEYKSSFASTSTPSDRSEVDKKAEQRMTEKAKQVTQPQPTDPKNSGETKSGDDQRRQSRDEDAASIHRVKQSRRSQSTARRKREHGLTPAGSNGSMRSLSTLSAKGSYFGGDEMRYPDPNSPSMIMRRNRAVSDVPDFSKGRVNLTTITAAMHRIRDGIETTKCEKAVPFPGIEDYDLYFKREYLQVTGSFKARGARNALLTLSQEQSANGVVTTSAGNHALAIAQQGAELGIPVTVLLPENVSPLRVKLCNRYNATTKLAGRTQTEVKQIALKMESEAENGQTFIDENDNPYVISGQGTMALEILNQVEDIDAIVIPVGGGGLLAGMSLAIKTLFPRIQIIAVESANCPSFSAALKAGQPIKVKTSMPLTLAVGLSFSKVSLLPFQLAKERVDKVVAVTEDYIALAVLRLLEKEKVLVEGAGAAGLAALIGGYLPELKGKRVVVPLCSGNLEATTLGRAIERGLYTDQRMVRFMVIMNDKPGALARLLHLIASTKASVKDLYQERTWLKSSVYYIQVKVVAELRNAEHGKELRATLHKRYHDDLRWNLDEEHSSEC